MKAVRSFARGLLVAVPVALAFAACEDDEDIFDIADIAGEFVADSAVANSVFRVIEDSDTTDVLEEGGRIELDLNADGTATGFLFAPDLGDGGSDIEEDLTGTWTFSNGNVLLNLTPDTFLNDLSFDFAGGRLITDETINGRRFQIVLVRL